MGSEAHVPFITWEIQDKALLDMHGYIRGGQDFLIDKSRDMGATWIIVADFHHYWLFQDNVSFLWVSATATDVDMHPTLNPDTIFYKHDYVNSWLPEWMRPPIHRRNMHIGNLLRGNSLDGEATTNNVGRGGRRTAIGFDEFAAVEDGDGMLEASSDTTACRAFNSTPKGPGTAFTKIQKHAKAGTKSVKLITLPWWEHPEKGRGRRLIEKVDGTKKYTSPWYENECKRRSSPREIAQNLDMDHMDSGSLFFDSAVIARHKSSYVKPPVLSLAIDFDKRYRPDEVETFVSKGQRDKISYSTVDAVLPWRFWTRLVDHRPDQTVNYVFGIDISNGMGASNSTVSVRCVESGEKVAEFADANTAPHDFARIVVAAAMWFGGSKAQGFPKLIWESNGPGGIFGKEIVMRFKYPNYYLERRGETVGNEQTDKYGWHSNRDKKATLLGLYRRAIARDDFINHCEMALDEAQEYVYYDTGAVGPANLIAESESARSTHGDRVIGDALTCLGVEEAAVGKPADPVPHNKSFAARRAERIRNSKDNADRWAAKHYR